MGSAWSSSKQISDVHVHFGGKKLRVTFAASDYDAQHHVPLRSFRVKLAKALAVPATSLTLYQLNPRKRLANMGATLEDYGIKSGADILAVQAEPPAPKQPDTPSQQIDSIVGAVDAELGPRIASFTASPPADFAERDKENRFLCETVLAKTIALDNVEVESTEDRSKRKQAIAKLQNYHRSIDKAMEEAASSTAEPARPESGPGPAGPKHTQETQDAQSQTTQAQTAQSQASQPQNTQSEAAQAEPKPAEPAGTKASKKNKKKNKRR